MAAVALAPAAVSISLDDAGAVRVTGVGQRAAHWPEHLRVSVDQPEAPPLAGTFRHDGSVLIFTPRHPFQPGMSYRVRFDQTELVLRVPAPVSTLAAQVEGIYPTASEWPENVLRFYIHFSASMSRGEAFARLHLIDLSNQTEVRLPFLEIHEELWDRDQRRLTVLFDPGRVKRGLVPHNEVGPPLVAGRRYRLVIDAAWPDAANRPLREGFAKEFTAGAAVRQGVNPREWTIEAPPAATREPLAIIFPRPLDAGLLISALSIPGLAGESRLDAGERRWLFVPDRPWPSRPLTIEIGSALEDIAGNRLGRAFDVDLDVFDRVKTAPAPPQRLTFQPR